jgi:hypothetical protein
LPVAACPSPNSFRPSFEKAHRFSTAIHGYGRPRPTTTTTYRCVVLVLRFSLSVDVVV